MAIELDSVQRPLRRLMKLLKEVGKDPPVEDVHQLRTQTRRLEAIVAALMLEEEPGTRELLKAVTPIRKAAGEVRDMDVLVSNVLGLAGGGEEECRVRLIEHLGGRRMKSARKLHHVVVRQGKSARHGLKRCVKRLGKGIEDRPARKRSAWVGEQTEKRTSEDALSVAHSMAADLGRWPRLSAENIHTFRIKVKTLGYVLELVADADAKFVDAVDAVKDRIGEWHDWQELLGIAEKVLDHEVKCGLLKQIGQVERKKFKQALSMANQVRARYLDASAGKRPRSMRS
jgi:CHAD domain-containing protein